MGAAAPPLLGTYGPDGWKAPKLTRDERIRAARGWLIRCRQTPSPERVQQLVPYVGTYPPRSLKARIADELVADGYEPTALLVDYYVQQERLKDLRRHPRLTEVEAMTVVGWIADYREQHGQGPTWNDMSIQFGWKYTQRQDIMNWLRYTRWVEPTNEPRSLRPGRRYHEALTKQSRPETESKRAPDTVDPTQRPEVPAPRQTSPRRLQSRLLAHMFAHAMAHFPRRP